MQPAYRSDQASVYQGDALTLARGLPSDSVDALITDPPYSSGGLHLKDRARGVHAKYVQTDSTRDNLLPAFPGDNRDQRSFGYWCTLWLAEAFRVLRLGAAACVFTDWRQLPTLSDALQAAGFTWRGIVVWAKPNGRRTHGRFANNCEYVVWGTKGRRDTNAVPGSLNGYHVLNCPQRRVHITEKPVELLRELVRIAPPGGSVLDLFAGSGTTGVAALLEGRTFTGVDLDPRCVQITIDRLIQAAAPALADGAA